jgi:hypothetical protein
MKARRFLHPNWLSALLGLACVFGGLAIARA